MLPLSHAKIDKKAARILTDQGQSVMAIEKISRVGGKLCMHGRLMGLFSTTVYVSVDDFFRMVPLLLKPGLLIFLLVSPFCWLRGGFKAAKERRK